MLAVTESSAKRLQALIKKWPDGGPAKYNEESQEQVEFERDPETAENDTEWTPNRFPDDDDDGSAEISSSPALPSSPSWSPTPKKRSVCITKWLLLHELSDTPHAPMWKGFQLDTRQGFWKGLFVSIRKW
jgi:hypothetical protein